MARNIRIKQEVPQSHVETGYIGVGTSPVQISSVSRKLTRGVTLKIPAAASNTVFVSEDRNMTAGTNTSRSGYPVEPGDVITIPVDDIADLWLVSNVTGPTNVSYFYS